MADNRVFNVNGAGDELLLAAISLAFEQEGKNTTAKAFAFDKEKGLVLLWHVENGATAFPAPLDARRAAEVVSAWLMADDAQSVSRSSWDSDYDHDGHNEAGWRVYVEDWGHVGNWRATICAIKPACQWYGK